VYVLAYLSEPFVRGAGGTITLGLTASALGCTWTASSNATWLTMNYGSGSGSSTWVRDCAERGARASEPDYCRQTFTVNQGPGTRTIELCVYNWKRPKRLHRERYCRTR